MDVKEVAKKVFWPFFVIVFLVVTIIIFKMVYNSFMPQVDLPDGTRTQPIVEQQPAITYTKSSQNIVPEPAKAIHKPVKNLKQGWSQEKVYEHEIIYGTHMAQDKEDNVLILSKGNNKIFQLSGSGRFSEYLDVNNLPMIQTIGYQPGKDRLLIIERGLYTYSDGKLDKINQIQEPIGVIEINEQDDTFYGCSPMMGKKINHYDVDGDLISTVVDNADGCFQMAVNEVNNKLYYSETYAGTITELDLTDNSRKIIATGMGIPGTFEPISVALDGNNNLYSFPGPDGLFKYEDGTFKKVIESIAGAGALLWSDEYSTFLQTNGAGANIISYNPTTKEAKHLTQYINSVAITQTYDGIVLICDSNYFAGIQKVSNSGLDKYYDLDGDCQVLELAGEDVYAGTVQGKVIKASDGSVLAEFDNFITSLSYDLKNDAIIVVTGDMNAQSSEVWRITLESATKERMAKLNDVHVDSIMPRATVDKEGNVYLIERNQNVIYKIVDGKPTVFITDVIENDAVTLPSIEYLSKENALLISGIQKYELWPLDNPRRTKFAENTAGVDNFVINENKDGDVLAIHSGEVFKFVYS